MTNKRYNNSNKCSVLVHGEKREIKYLFKRSNNFWTKYQHKCNETVMHLSQLLLSSWDQKRKKTQKQSTFIFRQYSHLQRIYSKTTAWDRTLHTKARDPSLQHTVVSSKMGDPKVLNTGKLKRKKYCFIRNKKCWQRHQIKEENQKWNRKHNGRWTLSKQKKPF